MSDIVEMTFSSLPSLFGAAFSTKNNAGGGTGTSRAFKMFIKSVGNIKNKMVSIRQVEKLKILHLHDLACT